MKDVLGYENFYSINEGGEIFSKRRQRFLKTHVSKRGYLVVDLKVRGARKTFTIHRLIATLYIPNPLGLPQINHINGVKTDNRIENLEWCSALDNIRHAFAHGLIENWRGQKRGEENYRAKLTEQDVKDIRILWAGGRYTLKQLGRKFHISWQGISSIVYRKNWKHVI